MVPSAILACLLVVGPHSRGPPVADVDFASRFGAFDGCFVLRDIRQGWTLRYRDERCAAAFAPCSTFKIPNALIGLETGVLADADTAFKWDGTPQRVKAWEKDHTL